MQQDIHFVWIGNELSLMEQLTIKLYQNKNLIPNLWSYNEIKNVPEGTIIRDAEEILPKSTLFKFRNDENRGSNFSQWSDRFQLTLLQKYGGWYSQLDVACIKLPEDKDYYFLHHNNTKIDVSVMKTPKDAPFLKDCLTELATRINADTCQNFDWEDSMRIIGNHIFNTNLSQYVSTNVEQKGYSLFMTGNRVPRAETEFIHWWNAESPHHLKNNPEKESYYYKLLKDNGLK